MRIMLGKYAGSERHCDLCGVNPLVRCITRGGRWARRQHRVRVYPVKITMEAS
ncbi:MAG TPA: hypothetical protein VFY84_19260 [Jiangellales bacterium]|nr:hypothetical protein [Jiangellales bacterium]